MLQFNDTKAIRARNRQTIRNSRDHRQHHAVQTVQEKLEQLLAFAITQAVRDRQAVSSAQITYHAVDLVATVNAIMKGGSHD